MSIKTSRWFIGLSLIPALVAVTGCETNKKNDDRSEGRALDDKHITADAKKALDADPTYKFTGVSVNTFAGTVQLGGFVDTDLEKRRASDVVQRVPGVHSVMNGLSIKPTAIPMTGHDAGTSTIYAEPNTYQYPAPAKSEAAPADK